MVRFMEFCEKCGSLMFPKKTEKGISLQCRKCGHKKYIRKNESFKFSTVSSKKSAEIVVVDKKAQKETLPVTTVQCPKCDNTEAYWWVQQTRSGDEPPTRFFKCTKCNHIWREYQ